MIKRPMLIIACVYICGLIIGRNVLIPFWFGSCLIVLCIAGALFFFLLYKKPDTRHLTITLILFSFFLIGLARENALVRHRDTFRLQIDALEHIGSMTISGTVRGMPEYRQGKIRTIFKNGTCKFDGKEVHLIGKVQVIISGDALEYIERVGFVECGDTLSFVGTIKRPLSRHNPTLFNYTAYLENKGIGGIARCHDEYSIVDFKKATGFDPFRAFINLAGHYRRKCEQLFIDSVPDRKGEILAGIFLGQGYRLDIEKRHDFTRAGVMHFFAVSGLHTALIVGLLYVTLSLFRISMRTRSLITIALIVFLMAFTGFRTSVVRAALMIIFLLASPFLKREVESINVLALAAFLVLLFNPSALWEAGFQLSYVAVFALLLFNPVCGEVFLFDLNRYPLKWHSRLAALNKYILRPFIVTLSVTLGLAPLLAHYFHVIPVISPITHLIFGTLGFLIIFCGFILATFGMLFPPLIMPFAYFVSGTIAVFEYCAREVSTLNWSAVFASGFPFYLTALYYAILAIGIHTREAKSLLYGPQRKFRLLFAIFGTLMIILWLPLVNSWLGNKLYVYMLDVGQGDAFYVEFPDGSNMLIDGGRRYPVDNGTYVIIPFLYNHGVDEIEVVVATHPDADHIGGLASVIEHLFVNMVLVNGEEAESKTWQLFKKAIEDTATPVHVVRRGMQLHGLDRAMIEVLNPDTTTLEQFNRNDNSIVLKIDYDKVSFLFTGDLGEKGEEYLIEQDINLNSHVLKVGHHGTARGTTESFLNALTPEGDGKPFVALISVDANNNYGHPAPALLERLRNVNAHIYRTDRDGAVCVISNGKRIGVKTFGDNPD